MTEYSESVDGGIAVDSITPSIWRCRWYPGAIAPKHLIKANLAGSYGFDPLRLGTDPEQLAWYAEAEKTNGRWAMAAVAGVPALDDP